MSAWTDFNDAEQQQSFELIPKGTIARVRMTIKPGGYDDAAQGWTGGYATQSFETGSVYLACEFVVLEGAFARRKMWSNIGLYSPKGPAWGNMGRTFVRAVLNSARNIRPQDTSPQAAAARRIAGLHELDGLEFLARIDVEKDGRGDLRNIVRTAVEPGEADFGHASSPAPAPRAALQPATTPSSTPAAPLSGKPAWAQ